VARFDRSIPPGKEGKITLRIKTRGYQGAISKSARVYTNDPRKKIELLTINAFVKVPIYLSNRYVYLTGIADRKITRTIIIKAHEKSPLKLEHSSFDLSKTVAYTIREVKPGRVFKIHFTSIPGSVGTYRGVLKLKTNYPEKPEITILIRAKFQKGT
jgi:hypothetical protein